jgi:DNA primase
LNKGFSSDWIEKLVQNNDIVTVINKYITLNKKGKTWWACCPFHYEKTPSFAVNEMEQFYHCFGCGASGNVIGFVKKFESLDFYDACVKLAEYAGMEVPVFSNDDNLIKNKKRRERIYQLLVDSARYYYNNLKLDIARPALEYIAKRKLDMQVIKDFGIGYSVGWDELITYLKSKGYTEEEMIDAGVADKRENGTLYDFYGKRLIFPIFNIYGNVVGFSGRVLEKSEFAKYKNTPQTLVFDKSKCIYGINQLKKLKQTQEIKEIVIVEGQMDVISLYKSGIKNAVACMGTALTINHAKDLKRFADKVILCFDGDSAGKKATLRSIEILNKVGISVYIVTIPNGHDPDEYVNLYGKSEWDKLLENALYWVEFLIKDFASIYNLEKLEEKNKFVIDALNVVRSLSTEAEQEIYLKMISELSNISLSVLKNDLNNTVKSNETIQDNNISQEDNSINLKENAYVKATKFIMSALLYKKDYASLSDNIRNNLLNPDYVQIYDFIKCEYNNNRVPIVSKLFDMFDVENNKDIYDLVNYVFSSGEDNQKYFEDCLNIVVKSGITLQKDKLLAELSKTKDNEERKKLMLEIQALILKEKNK